MGQTLANRTMTKARSIASGVKEHGKNIWLTANTAAMTACFAFNAYALPTLGSVDAAISSVVGFVVKIFQYVGWIFVVWALGSLIWAFKNDDSDSKSRAATYFLIGAALLAFSGIVTAVLGSGAAGSTSISF